MENTILLSCECPGLPAGSQTVAGRRVCLEVLPAGLTIAERLARISLEQRLATVGLVTLLTDVLDRDTLVLLKARLPNLRLIANYAVGFNNIDVQAAKELSLAVTNTPHVLADATADLTLALMLMVARRLCDGANEIQTQGRFAGWSPTYGLGIDLKGRTLGIVGLGDIGRKVAARAKVFGMNVVSLQSLRAGGIREDDVPRLSETEFLAATDVLSLHCPLTPQTRSWLNASRIAQLKKGSIVINTARGDVVDEAALASALQSGHLYGAGVDVFCGEPVVSDVLRAAPNLVILPHLGSATVETRTAMGAKVLENVSALLAGQMPLPTQVNL